MVWAFPVLAEGGDRGEGMWVLHHSHFSPLFCASRSVASGFPRSNAVLEILTLLWWLKMLSVKDPVL